MTAQFNERDPATWPVSSGRGHTVGLDIASVKDHSAMCAAAVFPFGGETIGVFVIKQWPAAALTMVLRATLVVDTTSNSAVAGMLAGRLDKPHERLICATLTAAENHTLRPEPLPIAMGGLKAVAKKWLLSKAELIETTYAEINGGTLLLGNTGNVEELYGELQKLKRIERASGSVGYGAPAGMHDDLAIALALVTFGCRRVGGYSSTSRGKIAGGPPGTSPHSSRSQTPKVERALPSTCSADM